MSHALSRTLGAVCFGLLALGVNAVSAQTTANGPYYATPSWDQTLTASTRFVVLSNMNSAAVLDRETGLVWERTPSTTLFPWTTPTGFFSFNFAAGHCSALSLGNRKGWRLPSIDELLSLVDPSQNGLPVGAPFQIQPTEYWSGTAVVVGGVQSAFSVDFAFGETGLAGTLQGIITKLVWCVRGPSI